MIILFKLLVFLFSVVLFSSALTAAVFALKDMQSGLPFFTLFSKYWTNNFLYLISLGRYNPEI